MSVSKKGGVVDLIPFCSAIERHEIAFYFLISPPESTYAGDTGRTAKSKCCSIPATFSIETLAGLREYAAASDDDLKRDIAALEETAREQAAALTMRDAEVLATLEAVDNICRRTELRLHYYRGMEWKEIAAIIGGSGKTISTRCTRALRACVPK